MSDVIGDPLEFIASGPTVISPPDKPDPTTILKELGVWDTVPITVQNAVQVFQKTGSTQNVDVDVQNIIVANNKLALYAFGETLKKNGYHYYVVSDAIAKDTNLYGSQLAHVISSTMTGRSLAVALQSANLTTTATTVAPAGNKIALLFGGECTVTRKGNGLGGRNQHIVLSVLFKLLEIQEFPVGKVEFALMSVGTDGQDGPTDAAGAVLTSDDLRFIRNSGLQWQKSVIDSYLNNNDSYNFWKNFNNGESHIVCGPSGTNVMDLQVLLFATK